MSNCQRPHSFELCRPSFGTPVFRAYNTGPTQFKEAPMQFIALNNEENRPKQSSSASPPVGQTPSGRAQEAFKSESNAPARTDNEPEPCRFPATKLRTLPIHRQRTTPTSNRLGLPTTMTMVDSRTLFEEESTVTEFVRRWIRFTYKKCEDINAIILTEDSTGSDFE